uniref:Myotubularin phosphatase domain-containing protein n=1 Tax=Ascaris lumbricoides TaxID=6252 RepID=A0A0M3HP20_ASCLU
MELSDAIERPRVDNVFLRKGPRQPQPGSLALIGHHMIFSPSETSPKSPKSSRSDNELWLLHRAVDRVISEPISRDNLARGGYLILKCKNFMICVFEVADLEDCMAVARSIEKLSNLSGIQHEYPFYYRCPFTVLDNGWTAFDTEQEFARLMVRCKEGWRISAVNKGFRVCSSYPEMVIVPKGIGDDYLRISATFRDGGRFPVLSYYHQETKSSIVRCGQPLIGPANRRCKEDETILNALLSSTSKGVLIDTRSKQLAQSAKSKGGGCEPQMNYSQWKYVHSVVPRIREIHDALTKLVELCNEVNPSTDRWLSKLCSSGWMHAVADTLTAAAIVAQCVHCEGSAEVPVVVHGAEGTDSTLLVTSLSQLLLDSDARTIRGFESLIEREWIAAGHPFSARCAHSAYANGVLTGPGESPVFLCFLDCVWQVYQQFPCSFEFTEEFLIFLFEHAYASEFGSFLGNNEKEKYQLEVKTRTVSLWSYVNNPEILRSYVNALYEPNDSVLWPSVAPQSIVFWERLFLRWLRDWKQTDGVKQTIMEWKTREKELQSKVLVLRRQLIELSKEVQLQNHAAAAAAQGRDP